MIRIICQMDDAGMAANVGGRVLTTYKSFLVDLLEVEKWLVQSDPNAYCHRQIIGAELIAGETLVAEVKNAH